MMDERRILRRARRQRNCRRRPARFDNRERDGFLAPSQKVIVNSRLKSIKEFIKCYPIDTVVIEDVKFNHAKKRYGKNFSTIEIGKKLIYEDVKEHALLQLYQGFDTKEFRKNYGYIKSRVKDAEVFTSHCSDSLALAVDSFAKEHIPQGKFIVVDDTYRPVRRKLHYTQPKKGGLRERYSTGNFKGIRKGTICEFGQIVGGTKSYVFYGDFSEVPRKEKVLTKIMWLSKRFKTRICA